MGRFLSPSFLGNSVMAFVGVCREQERVLNYQIFEAAPLFSDELGIATTFEN